MKIVERSYYTDAILYTGNGDLVIGLQTNEGEKPLTAGERRVLGNAARSRVGELRETYNDELNQLEFRIADVKNEAEARCIICDTVVIATRQLMRHDLAWNPTESSLTISASASHDPVIDV